MPKLTVITRKVPLVLVCFQECIQKAFATCPAQSTGCLTAAVSAASLTIRPMAALMMS